MSCTIETTYNNRQKDKQAANSVVEKYYKYMEASQPKHAMELMSEKNAISIQNLSEIFATTNQELGRLEKFTLDSAKTNVVKGKKNQGRYTLFYTVLRKKYKTNDMFILTLEDSVIKILDYKAKVSFR